MASTVWKGHVTFGLVSIPVRLYKAAHSEKISFHQLHRPARAGRKPVSAPTQEPAREPDAEETLVEHETASQSPVYRIKQAAVSPVESVPVPRSELVKGFEYEKDRYVVIEEEEIQTITPKTAKEMQIQEFVKLAEVDPIYFENSYYVTPDQGGEKPYALLFAVLRQTGYVALAQVAMHRREHIVILRPGEHGIVAHIMYYADEIRKAQEYRTDTSLVTKKEMDVAGLLVEALAAHFEPEKYKDTYRTNLQALIDAKMQGKEVVRTATPEKSEVIDIMQALRQSLELARKPATMAKAAGSAQPSSASGKKARRRA